MKILKMTTAVLLLTAGTFAVAQQRNEQMGPTTPQPPAISKDTPQQGVGSRPLGPATTSPSTSNAEADKQPVTPKNLEKEGKSGNN